MPIIAHISDLHFGKHEPAIVDALAKDLNDHPSTLTVVSGDLTQRARAGQFRAAMGFLRRIPQPQLVIPGNHDIPLYDVVRRFTAPLHNYCRYVTHELWPTYQDDRMMVLGMNTARSFSWRLGGFWKDGRIDPDQLARVKETVQAAPENLLKVVVTHHPFIPPPGEPMSNLVHGAWEALEVMETCGVDLLLAGHLHNGYHDDIRAHYQRAKRSVLSVQAGTATSFRRRGQPNSYNRIGIDGNRLSLQVRSWNGTIFAERSRRSFARIDGIWKPDSVE